MGTTDAVLHRTESRDGTEIGYWSSGDGPPLVLVHGGFGDHTRWNALLPHLRPQVTVHAMDRRGRGASGDHVDYDLEREFEDVAAVVDAVADESGSAVNVYGVSLGGMCAVGSAALTSNLGRLALYEGWPYVPPETAAPAGFVERAEQMLEDGDPEAALEAGYRELLRLDDEEIHDLKMQPEWSDRVAAAHTIPRELRSVSGAERYRERLPHISVPTLLLVGEKGPDWQADTVAAAMPNARVAVLDGQGHMADLFAPQLVAKPLLEFLLED